MTRKLLFSAGLIASGLFVLSAQQPAPEPIFTTEQVESGRVLAAQTCSLCHTPSLLGRKGDPGESPALSELSADMQEFVGRANGKVPPLVGPVFLERNGGRTVEDFTKYLRGALITFLPDRTDDASALGVAAYVLMMNGAKPGDEPLTMDSQLVVNTLTTAQKQ